MSVFIEKLRQVIGSSTLEEFASAVGEPTQRVKDVLRAKQKAPADLLVKMHVRLGVDLNWLLNEDDTGAPRLTLSARESNLLDNYRAAEEAGRRAIEQTSAAVTKHEVEPVVKRKKAA